jgi:hypothetical protein
MADNSRASFVLVNRPPIFFNEVEGAETYSFALTRKELDNGTTQDVLKNSVNSIWIKKICASELKTTSPNYTYSEPGFLFFEYPDGEADLENLVTYIIIVTAETFNGTKTARGEFTLLEQDVSNTFRNVFEAIQSNPNKTLIDQFNEVTNKILSSSFSIKKNESEFVSVGPGPGHRGIFGCPPSLFLS